MEATGSIITEQKTASEGRRLAPGVLVAALLLVQTFTLSGCGFGWLYMRIGDSLRIKGMKILATERTRKRFKEARECFRRALSYYDDSILYDPTGNPEVYYKYGFTYLLLDPPDTRSAKAKFEQGADVIKKNAIAEGRVSEGDTEKTSSGIEYLEYGDPDHNYPMMFSGLGYTTFLEAVASDKDEDFDKAIDYTRVAMHLEELANKARPMSPAAKKVMGYIDRFMDWLNLRELVSPTPFPVQLAQIYNYLAERAQKRGQEKLAAIYLKESEDVLEQAGFRYEKDSRYLGELCHLYFLKGDLEKCRKYVDSLLEEITSYSDKIYYSLLKAEILVRLGKYNSAVELCNNILEAEPSNARAAIIRAEALAHVSTDKTDLSLAMMDLENIASQHEKDSRILIEIGKVYMVLSKYELAESMFLKAYYIEPDNVEILHNLATLYKRTYKKEKMKEVFRKLLRVSPTSKYAEEARKALAE